MLNLAITVAVHPILIKKLPNAMETYNMKLQRHRKRMVRTSSRIYSHSGMESTIGDVLKSHHSKSYVDPFTPSLDLNLEVT